jgi:predicted small secreted protein
MAMKVLFAGLAAAAMLLAGCNTMHGLGEDITAGGNWFEGVLKNGDEDKTRDEAAAPATPDAGRPSDSNRVEPAPETSMSLPSAPVAT